MDKPIISPVIIYLMDLLHDLEFWVVITSVFLFIGLIIVVILYIVWRVSSYDNEYEDDVEQNEVYISLLKKGTLIFLLSLLFTIAIPNDTTMYQMLISNYITQENLDVAGDTIKDSVDYIFEKIDELGDK